MGLRREREEKWGGDTREHGEAPQGLEGLSSGQEPRERGGRAAGRDTWAVGAKRKQRQGHDGGHHVRAASPEGW